MNFMFLDLLVGVFFYKNVVKKGIEFWSFYWVIVVNWLKAWKLRIFKFVFLFFGDSRDV